MQPHRHMLHTRHAGQNGQATTEFLVCLLALIPLFFGIYYFARYADIKQSAIQASRYVAFERTLDPYGRAKTDTQLAEEARARFFAPIDRNNGAIRYRDTTSGLDTTTKTGRVPLWTEWSGSGSTKKPLIERYSSIGVGLQNAGPLTGGPVGKLQETLAEPVFKLPSSGIVKAQVTVPLNNIAHFEALRNINVGMPGATAIGSGVWNANGTKGNKESVCDRVVPTVLGHYVAPVATVLGAIMSPFEQAKLDVGLVLPDYDIPGSVRTTGNAQVPYIRQNGNRC